MNFSDDALRKLAEQLGRGGPSSSHPDREALEASLLPMIRCALRTGRGLPPLVRWVQNHVPGPARPHLPGQPLGPEWAAPSMARLLCTTILQQFRAPASPRQQACETVVSG